MSAVRFEYRCYPICEECGKVSSVPLAGEAPPLDWRRWVGRWPDLFTCSLRCAVAWLLSNGRRDMDSQGGRSVNHQAELPLEDPTGGLPAPIGATVRVAGIPRKKFTVRGMHKGGSVTLIDQDQKWHNFDPARVRVPKAPTRRRRKGGKA